MKTKLIALLCLAPICAFAEKLTLEGTDNLPAARTKINANFTELYSADLTHALQATTLTLSGTANEITISGGAQSLAANRTWTASLPSALTFTGKTVTGGTFSGISISGTTGIALGSDATGDIYYRNSSGNLTRLPVGTNGHVLTLSGGLPAWAAVSGTGDAMTSGTLAQFAATTSAQLAGVLTNETGTGGVFVLSEGPTIADPIFTGTVTAAALVVESFQSSAFRMGNGASIRDANDNQLITFTQTASAVNEVTLANAATGNNPRWTATGGDTDVGIDWLAKGGGKFNFRATASGPAELRLWEDSDNGSNYVGILAPATLGSNVTLTLPSASGILATTSGSGMPDVWVIACSDETTDLTTGAAKVTFRAPYAATITAVRANLNTASSSGAPAIDINDGVASIFSTTLTIDQGEETSVSAATAAVISDSAIADDAEITIDIDTAGTGAKGLKVHIYVTRQ